jgi:hypothetical protein
MSPYGMTQIHARSERNPGVQRISYRAPSRHRKTLMIRDDCGGKPGHSCLTRRCSPCHQ